MSERKEVFYRAVLHDLTHKYEENCGFLSCDYYQCVKIHSKSPTLSHILGLFEIFKAFLLELFINKHKSEHDFQTIALTVTSICHHSSQYLYSLCFSCLQLYISVCVNCR